jgi:hypothetical protein
MKRGFGDGLDRFLPGDLSFLGLKAIDIISESLRLHT